MLKTIFAVAVLLITSVYGVPAQVIERGQEPLVGGREFLISLLPVDPVPTEKPLPQPLSLFIVSRQKTTVRLASLGGSSPMGYAREYTVEPDRILRVPLPTSFLICAPGAVDSNVIRVTSEVPITVRTYSAWMGNGEMQLVHPVRSGWGTRFRTVHSFQDEWAHNNEPRYGVAHASVVAATDSTVVSIQTRHPLEAGAALEEIQPGQYRVVLDSGERVYLKWAPQVGVSTEWSTDATGTLIESNHPIGVYCGMTKVALMRMPERLPPTGQFSAEAHFVRNSLMEMALPESVADTLFVTVPIQYTPIRVFNGGAVDAMDPLEGDVIRVLALEDETIVWVKRLDGDGWINLTTLAAGESYVDTTEINARVWRTSKPAHMYQYGKSYAKLLSSKVAPSEGTPQGHPTVEAGMPMLMSIPGVDHMVSRGAFQSPEGMDNFFAIVFKTADIQNITFDGRVLANAFITPVQELDGTPYSYVRSAVGDGDHFVTSASDDVQWMAWTYGSLDGLQQGRAYGSPVGVNLTTPCDDSLAVTASSECRTMSGTVSVEGDAECGAIVALYADTLTNAELISVDPLGRLEASWVVRSIDAEMDARVVMFAQSSSGRFVRIEQTVKGEYLFLDEDQVAFGTLPIGIETCSTTVVRNLSERAVTISSVTSKTYPDSVRIATTLPFTLEPDEERELTYCIRPWTTTEVIDTLVWSSSCGEFGTMVLTYRGEEPGIYCSDQQWGFVKVGDTVAKEIEIINSGDVEIVVTGYDTTAVSEHFSFTGARGIFPFTLEGRARRSLEVLYHPRSLDGGSHQCSVAIYSTATRVDTVTIWNGTPVDSATSVREASDRDVALAPSPISRSQHSALRLTLDAIPDRVMVVDVNGAEVYQHTATATATSAALHIPVSAFRTPGWYGVVVERQGARQHLPILVVE